MRLSARMLPRMNWENDMNIGGVETVVRERASDNHLCMFRNSGWVSATGEIWSFQPFLSLSSFPMLRMSFFGSSSRTPQLVTCHPRSKMKKKKFLPLSALFYPLTTLVEWLDESNRWTRQSSDVALLPPSHFVCCFPPCVYGVCRSISCKLWTWKGLFLLSFNPSLRSKLVRINKKDKEYLIICIIIRGFLK